VVERRVTYIAAILVIVLSGANLYLAWRIFMNQTELLSALTAVSDELAKATTEITTAISNSGTTTPEVDAAVSRLQAAARALDNLNPDAPTA